jgi:hypothetical protein
MQGKEAAGYEGDSPVGFLCAIIIEISKLRRPMMPFDLFDTEEEDLRTDFIKWLKQQEQANSDQNVRQEIEEVLREDGNRDLREVAQDLIRRMEH